MRSIHGPFDSRALSASNDPLHEHVRHCPAEKYAEGEVRRRRLVRLARPVRIERSTAGALMPPPCGEIHRGVSSTTRSTLMLRLHRMIRFTSAGDSSLRRNLVIPSLESCAFIVLMQTV
ncbi:hypothetical protein BDV93DRAFT_525589 [Ceratobasidium sp. AG-I]|nr:hypothetical protein BDV93DRAFT_525589 [Ceratobasidium sp. AG-I]